MSKSRRTGKRTRSFCSASGSDVGGWTRISPRRRTWPIIALSVGLSAVVGLLGSIAGPKWEPAPADISLPISSDDVAIASASPAPSPEGTFEISRTDLRIDLGPVSVPAWLFEPVDAPPGPAVVFIHGAGTVEPDAFAGQVEALTSAGVRTLVPAKRMDTYSTRERDYSQMANDYLKSWQTLRELPGVDPARVGIYGESEGAWIAPIAAVAEPEVAFLILASAPVVSPREQAAYATANYLYNTNVPRGMFRAIPRALGATIPGGGFEYIDFDVRPYLQQIGQPVLMTYGTADASMPIVQGADITADWLARGGNTALTVRYFAGADHGLRAGGELATGFTTVLTDWVWGLPASAAPQDPIAGATPEQRFLAEPVPAPRWYASGDFLVYSAISVGLLCLIGVALCTAAAIRAGRRSPVVRSSIATVLAAYCVIAVFIGYIGQIADLAVNYQLNDLLVLGGWVLVHLSGLFAVTTAVISVRRIYLARIRGEALDPLTRAGMWLSHLGALAVLITASYWGVFPGAG